MAEEIKINSRQLSNLFQMENQKFNESQQKLGMLRTALNETSAAKEALNAISNSKKNEKMLIPVGAGVFVDARVESSKDAIVLREGGAAIPKKITEIEKELEKKAQDFEKALEREMQINSHIFSNLNNLSTVMRQAEMTQRQQKKQA